MFLDTAIEFLRARYGYALVAIALFASGALVGWLHEHENLIKYRASMQALAKEQERQNAENIARHNETKHAIKEDYENRLSDLHDYYRNRLRDQSACRVRIPTAPAKRSDEKTGNTIPATRLAEDCAAVTLQLEELQKWVRETR